MKRILVVIDRRWVSKMIVRHLSDVLGKMGFDVVTLEALQAPKPVEVIQLDKLSSGQYRRLIDKINAIKEEYERASVPSVQS